MFEKAQRFSVSRGVSVVLAAACPSWGVVPTRTVALSGQHAPGTPVGVGFSTFGAPRLSATGRTAFSATLTGTGVGSTNDAGIWSERTGTLALVARTGTPAPGTPAGVNFNSFGMPVVNGPGRTAFATGLTGAGVDFTNNEGIWSEGSGVLVLVAREGSAAPGTATGAFIHISPPVLDGAGRTAFLAFLTGTGFSNDTGIWSEGGGSLALVARAGSPAAGTAAGAHFEIFAAPVLNRAGHTAFFAGLNGVGVDFTNNEGIWSEGGGTLALVARSGSQAPGTPVGVNFNGFDGLPVLNGADRTAFWALLRGTGVDTTNESGIWSEGGGSLDLVARGGSPAPGTLAGVNFNSFGTPVLNGAGHTAFFAGLTGAGINATNDLGIWSQRGGMLDLVARKGAPAPGTPSGVCLGSFADPMLNGAGRIAFFAFLAGSAVTVGVNDKAIFVEEPIGTLQLVARSGDAMQVAPGDSRTIASLVLGPASGGEDGRPTSLNQAGQVAFLAGFTDGSIGIFVTNWRLDTSISALDD